MSKSKHKRSRKSPDRAATTDIVSQLECALRHPQATLIGALIGGVVPWFARTLAHEEVPAAWSTGNYGLVAVMLAVVLGCACFSALTVYKFGRAAFDDSRKALGFVLAIEGVMLVSHGITSGVALGILIVINAVANGSVIALSREATCRRREADGRRAATRGRSRSVESAAHAEPATQSTPIVTAEPRRPRAARTKAPIRWNPVTFDDVIDAEVVSEQRLLS